MGTTQAIKDFVGKCTRGPATARVAHIDLEATEPPEETDFVFKPTL